MTTKKQKPATSKNPVRKPTARQRGFVKNLIEGKSARTSAIDAGYAVSSANHATTDLIKKPAVQKLIETALQKAGITDELLAQRMKEGLDAKETKFFQFQGAVTETRNVIDFGQRLSYASLIFKLRGELSDKVEHSVSETYGQLIERANRGE